MELFSNLAVSSFSAGVDEVGRGPLAGPVVAGAVILNSRRPIAGLADSKRLTPRRREALAAEIKTHALAWALGHASVAEIDAMNILRASHLAMQRAVAGLSVAPEVIFVDGNLLPAFEAPAVAVVKGDSRVAEISAGAILAKVARDNLMREMDVQLPGYGFAKHKGYPTAEHLAALAQRGPCAEHRRSFAPVRNAEQARMRQSEASA
jgi:ribonuclease HII